MKKYILRFACGKMLAKLLSVVLILPVLLLVLDLFIKIDWIYILPTILLAIGIEIIYFIVASGFGSSVFKSAVLTKISEKGLANVFCKIEWKEIKYVGVEQIKLKRWLGYSSKKDTDCGLVVCFSKLEEGKTFREYSVKDMIFVPFNEKTKKIIFEFSKDKNDLCKKMCL